jgi:hypothetical protein
MAVSCFLVAINGLKKFVLNIMNLEFPGMDIIFLTYADDIAVAITADPKRESGFVAMQRII